MISEREITAGLRSLGLDLRSAVIVHSSLRSFGPVGGGAEAVCAALVEVCGTVLLPAGTWDLTGVPAPPHLVRPHNAYRTAPSWAEFDAALKQAVPFRADLPIDRELGRIPETMRQRFPPPARRPSPAEVMIGNCRAGRIAVADVLAVAEGLIGADPAVLLCDDADCRCGAALQQRLA